MRKLFLLIALFVGLSGFGNNAIAKDFPIASEIIQTSTVKVYVLNNYFYMEIGGVITSAHKSQVEIKKYSTTATSYRVVFKQNKNSTTNLIEFNRFRDEDGNAFSSQTAFEQWYTENTGFDAGGGNGQGVARTEFNLGTFTSFSALVTHAQGNLSDLHNDTGQVSIATVTGEAVYQYSGEDTPSTYPTGDVWFVKTNLRQGLSGTLTQNTFPIAGASNTLTNSSLRETTDQIISSKTIVAPDGSLMLGIMNLSNAGFNLQLHNEATNQSFYPVAVELEQDGSSSPFYEDFSGKSMTDAVANKSETFTGTSIQFIISSDNRGVALRYDFESTIATNDVNLVIRANSHTDANPVYDYERANGHKFNITNGANQLWLFDLLDGATDSDLGLFFTENQLLYVTVESDNNLSLRGQTISGQTIPSIAVWGRTSTKKVLSTDEEAHDLVKTVVVSANGDDNLDGKHINNAVATIATARSLLYASGVSGHKQILCLDASSFVNSTTISLDEGEELNMPFAELQGDLASVANGYAKVLLFKHSGSISVGARANFTIRQQTGNISIQGVEHTNSEILINEFLGGTLSVSPQAEGTIHIRINEVPESFVLPTFPSELTVIGYIGDTIYPIVTNTGTSDFGYTGTTPVNNELISGTGNDDEAKGSTITLITENNLLKIPKERVEGLVITPTAEVALVGSTNLNQQTQYTKFANKIAVWTGSSDIVFDLPNWNGQHLNAFPVGTTFGVLNRGTGRVRIRTINDSTNYIGAPGETTLDVPQDGFVIIRKSSNLNEFTVESDVLFNPVSRSANVPVLTASSSSIPVTINVGTDLTGNTYSISYSVNNVNSAERLRLVGFAGSDDSNPTIIKDNLALGNNKAINFTFPSGVSFAADGSKYTLRLECYMTVQDVTDTPCSYVDFTITAKNLQHHELIHFGFVNSTQTAANINFTNNDISTSLVTNADYTVSGIPNDNSLKKIYFAIPEIYVHPTSINQGNFNITNQFTKTTETFNGEEYIVYLMNTNSAVNSSYNNAVLTLKIN